MIKLSIVITVNAMSRFSVLPKPIYTAKSTKLSSDGKKYSDVIITFPR